MKRPRLWPCASSMKLSDSAASHPKEINPKGELQAILQDILPETPS